jgi:hypothetical protein
MELLGRECLQRCGTLQREQRFDEVQRVARFDGQPDQPEERRQERQMPAHGPQQKIQEQRGADRADHHEQLCHDPDAPQRLHRRQVGRRRRRIPADDDPAPDEQLHKDAQDDDDQVHHPLGPCQSARRCVESNFLHGPFSLLIELSAEGALRGASHQRSCDEGRVWAGGWGEGRSSAGNAMTNARHHIQASREHLERVSPNV